MVRDVLNMVNKKTGLSPGAQEDPDLPDPGLHPHLHLGPEQRRDLGPDQHTDHTSPPSIRDQGLLQAREQEPSILAADGQKGMTGATKKGWRETNQRGTCTLLSKTRTLQDNANIAISGVPL